MNSSDRLVPPRVGSPSASIALLATLLLLPWASGPLAGCKPRSGADAPVRLLNVSYDPTRELYAELNPLFAAAWQAEHGQPVVIDMSHGGSGRQARAVIDGLDADVVTLATGADIDAIAASGAVSPGWREAIDEGYAPFYSTIVFVVREGNPKRITDWGDLIRADVDVVMPNPKTSGGARWNYLAALAHARRVHPDSEDAVVEFMRSVYANVPVLDTGARGSTTTFAQNGIGDVLVTWENEAHLMVADLGADRFDLVVPSISVRAEPPVAIVDRNCERHGTVEVARAYLRFLHRPEAQEVAARHHYRPTDPDVAARFAAEFPTLELVSIDAFGGWAQAQSEHFADGGLFDRIHASR